jgi:transcriptional regulator with XRE-family HTH domain
LREGRQRGLRLFQRKINAHSKEIAEHGGPRLRGVAASSIQNYLNGDADPPLRFLREAARLLEVREAWLICGVGFPTEAEQAAAVGLWEARHPGYRGIQRILRREAISRVLGKSSFGYWELPDPTRESVLRGFDTYCGLLPALAGLSDESPTEEKLARWYASYLAAPFTLLDIDAEALEPAERALIFDALIRPLDVFRWAARREEAGRRAAEREAELAELKKGPLWRLLEAAQEKEVEGADVEDQVGS